MISKNTINPIVIIDIFTITNPFILCTLYLLMGLAILAMCGHLLWDNAGNHCGIHQRLSTCLGIHQTPERYAPAVIGQQL